MMSDILNKKKAKSEEEQLEEAKAAFKRGADYTRSKPNNDASVKPIQRAFNLAPSVDETVDELATLVPKTNRSQLVTAAVMALKSMSDTEIKKWIISVKN